MTLIHFRGRTYPVFIIVDDGGFPYVDVENLGEEITLDAYTNVLGLAKEFKIRIPICFTMQYLDINNISGYGQPISYANELIDLLRDNQECIEIGYHGLTHDIENHVGEFLCIDTDTPVPEEIQREHIYKSYLIYKDLGLNFPKLFVPPYHAWELGTTDKILAEYGVQYLVSCRRLKYAGHTYKWGESQYLTFLPRESMGIVGRETSLSMDKLETVKRYLLPRSMVDNLLIGRRPVRKPVHSYMTHIGNFMGRSYEFWRGFFQYVEQNPKYQLLKSSEDVINKHFNKEKLIR